MAEYPSVEGAHNFLTSIKRRAYFYYRRFYAPWDSQALEAKEVLSCFLLGVR